MYKSSVLIPCTLWKSDMGILPLLKILGKLS
uniref:Uncharacterized protein n=1 Tax=Anguilla anguilla TaxID=7936 RepID=A0A0E9TXS4_ANGAN